MDAQNTGATERRQTVRLLIVLVLIGSFFFVELIGARIAKSDVLEADAFHLLMDVLALAISLGAMRVASRRPSARFTYGLRRAEPIAALANGVLVIGVAIELVRHGLEHLNEQAEPKTGIMLQIAIAALVVNALNAWLLHGAMGHHGHAHHGHAHGHDHKHEHEHDHGHDHDHAHDHGHDHAHAHAHPGETKLEHEHELHDDRGHQLNLRGAWLHLLGDALGSVAAFSAGVAIKLGAPIIVDPLASFIVVAILTVGAVRLLRDAGLVLLDAAPPHLPVDKVKKTLLAVEGVESVHSLHVWSLGTGHDAIAAHVRTTSSDPRLGERAGEQLRKKLGVEYVTVQVELD